MEKTFEILPVFPAGFPAHDVYDRPANSAPSTVGAGHPQCLWQAQILAPAAVHACLSPTLWQISDRVYIRGVQYCNRMRVKVTVEPRYKEVGYNKTLL